MQFEFKAGGSNTDKGIKNVSDSENECEDEVNECENMMLRREISAPRRYCEVICEVSCFKSQPLARERYPKKTLICTAISCGVRLDPRVARVNECRVAWLDG